MSEDIQPSSPKAEVKARSLARLGDVVAGLPAGPAKGIFEGLAVATRARAGFEVPELMALEVSRRMGALELIAANQPATAALAEAARSVLWQTSTFATLSDRHLAMWAELSLDEGGAARAVEAARLSETNSADRIRIFGRLLAAGVPRTTAGVLGLCEALEHEVEVDAVLTSWLSRARVAECEALFMQIRSPGARLEAVAAQAALGWRPAQWEPWLVVADVALEWAKRGQGPAEMGPPRLAVNLARRAQLLRLSGVGVGPAGQVGKLWQQAIEEAEREAQPAMAARVHRAMVFAAAGDLEAWLGVVRSIGADRAYLRDAESWLSVRCEVVRSMVGAVGSDPAHVDRAHQELRELGQRLPSRWYELFYAAVVARELARVGRSTEVVMAQLEAWLREGLPRPVVPVSTEELVGPLLEVDAERVWRLGEGLARSAAQHATWLSAVVAA